MLRTYSYPVALLNQAKSMLCVLPVNFHYDINSHKTLLFRIMDEVRGKAMIEILNGVYMSQHRKLLLV